MCIAIEEMKKESEQIGISKGVEIGITKGVETGTIDALKNIMNNLQMTAQQAMEAIGIPKDQQQTYLQKL